MSGPTVSDRKRAAINQAEERKEYSANAFSRRLLAKYHVDSVAADGRVEEETA